MIRQLLIQRHPVLFKTLNYVFRIAMIYLIEQIILVFSLQITTASTGLSALIIVAIAVGATACVLFVVAIAVAIVLILCCVSRRNTLIKNRDSAQAPPITSGDAIHTYENSGAESDLQTPATSYYMDAEADFLFPPISSSRDQIDTPIPENFKQSAGVSIADLSTNTPIVVPSAPPLELDEHESEQINEFESGHQVFVTEGEDLPFTAEEEDASGPTYQNEGVKDYEEAGCTQNDLFTNPLHSRIENNEGVYQLSGVAQNSSA